MSRLGFFKGIALGIAMFSRIPMPRVDWNEKNMRYMLCGFPLVGVVIGFLLWFWTWLCGILNFGTIIRAAGLTLIPIALSGGIHLEGFCDVSDAIASRAEPERKRQIMKDSHIGAFAAISLCAYLLIYFAFCCELTISLRSLLLLSMVPVLSRSMSGLSVIFFPASTNQGLLRSFKDSADKVGAIIVLFVFWIAAAVLSLVYLPIAALAMLLTAAVALLILYLVSWRQFKGMSGDLAGWFLCLAELFMLIGLTIVLKV